MQKADCKGLWRPRNTINNCAWIGHYRPPNSTNDLLTSLALHLEKIDLSQFSNFMLLGDFNIDYSNSSHPLFNKLNHIACTFGLEQIVREPTHVHHNHSLSRIDLVFMSNAQLANLCSIVPPLSNSDHNGILIRMRWKQSGSSNCPNNSKGRTVWIYNHADWDRANELIEYCDWDALYREKMSMSRGPTGVKNFC